MQYDRPVRHPEHRIENAVKDFVTFHGFSYHALAPNTGVILSSDFPQDVLYQVWVSHRITEGYVVEGLRYIGPSPNGKSEFFEKALLCIKL